MRLQLWIEPLIQNYTFVHKRNLEASLKTSQLALGWTYIDTYWYITARPAECAFWPISLKPLQIWTFWRVVMKSNFWFYIYIHFQKFSLLMTHNNKVKSQNADFGHNYLKMALFQNDVKGTSDQLHWPRCWI